MGSLSLLDPAIAFTYGMLAAHSLGLGSCWIGFAIQSLFKNREMGRLLGIPRDMIVAGVMTLGHPARRYSRVPPRNKLEVRWLVGREGAGEAGGGGDGVARDAAGEMRRTNRRARQPVAG